MLKTLAMMYVTLAPAIMAGILNMLWCKLHIMKFASVPVDNGRNFSDGRRIFGDNKTWKGIIGYVLFNTVFTVIWGIICSASSLGSLNFFYLDHDNTPAFNILVGVLLGLGYSLFELPNSFLKRRLDITPGKTVTGFKKVFFIFLDQADSLFGCALVVWIFYPIGILLYLAFVLVGAATHLLLNMMLFFMKLRKNMF
ncbi:MAG: CDP-archaeol synthase [Clostridiales bacterium]|nr:CDP-archaeol synthase [Clostridiales bacterium]